MDQLEPSIALECAKILYPAARPIQLKLSIVGAARLGIIWARANRFTAWFVWPAMMNEPNRVAFGFPEAVDCPAFTFETAAMPSLWGATSEILCRSPKRPIDLPSKWQTGFRDNERTTSGTLVAHYEEVTFDHERLIIALSRPDFLEFGKALLVDFVKAERGRPNKKDWPAAMAELVARTAAKDFVIPASDETQLLAETFTDQLGQSFAFVAPAVREPDSRELKKWGNEIAERLVTIRKLRKQYKRMKAPLN